MNNTHTPGIPDSVQSGLDILFIGYNPSLRSGEVGHNYAGRGNRFWKLLHDSGLTDRLMHPSEDRDLLQSGYGFTNIVARPTRRADEITREEYAAGRVILRQLLEQTTPKIACYVGKGVYEQYAQRKDVPWGVQHDQKVAHVIDYVVPSSSGLVRMPYPEILSKYRGLFDLLQHVK